MTRRALAAFAAPKRRPIPRPCRQATSEGAILSQILSALRLLGIPTYRLAVGAFHLPAGDRRQRFVRMGTPGVCDVLALLPGGRGALAIEVKSQRGRLSVAQVMFRDACRAAGVRHVVARSWEDVVVFLGSKGPT